MTGTLTLTATLPVPSVAIAKHEALLLMAAAVTAILELIVPVTPETAAARRRKTPLKMPMAGAVAMSAVVIPAMRRAIFPLEMTAVLIVQKNRRDSVAEGNAVIRMGRPVSAIIIGDRRRARDYQTQAQASGKRDTG